MSEHCTTQDSIKLCEWIESLGGKTRVGKKLGIDPSTLWRYEVGELETPKLLLLYIKQSEEIAQVKDSLAQRDRHISRVNVQLDKLRKNYGANHG